jgi:hypothetical protein
LKKDPKSDFEKTLSSKSGEICEEFNQNEEESKENGFSTKLK